MPAVYSKIERLLPFVETPGQYVGGEVNAVHRADAALSVCLAFPDTYAIGMSHVGLKILYNVLNRRPSVYCERAFAPWPDVAGMMRKEGIPAFSLETHRPLGQFDVLGFSMQYELNATNVLLMLDLAGIPLRATERGDEHPLILGGGALAFNPEPLAPFFDLFIIGEAEDAICELADLLIRHKGAGRPELLSAATRSIEGVYVPGLAPAGEQRIRRRIVRDLDAAPFPTDQVVPNVGVVHDRLAVEIMRGCPRRCRFCQAASIYRPLRIRKPETIRRLISEGLAATGHNEVSLLSLSSGDYPGFVELVRSIVLSLAASRTSVSLPSLRVTPELIAIPEIISVVRKSGLTFAPECATDRLRRVTNKDMSNDELLDAAAAAWRAGWETVKLYFMVGLPGERTEDVAAIPALLKEVADLRRRHGRRPGRVNVSLATFVPKPHTTFQWAPMDDPETVAEKQRVVLAAASGTGGRRSGMSVKSHDRFMSEVEALIARGNRSVADVIEGAYRAGEIFSAWDEHFHYEAWQKAAQQAGVDMTSIAHRERQTDEPLPWDFIDAGVSRDMLASDWQAASAMR